MTDENKILIRESDKTIFFDKDNKKIEITYDKEKNQNDKLIISYDGTQEEIILESLKNKVNQYGLEKKYLELKNGKKIYLAEETLIALEKLFNL